MKQLIAMFLAFFMSLANSTEFELAEEKAYTEDYYTINQDDPPDYREYYGNVSTVSGEFNCKTTNFSAQGMRVDSSEGYWFVNNMSLSLESLDSSDYNVEHHKNNDKKNIVDYYICKGAFTDGNYIIMPYLGTLQSESKTNDCKTMTVLCTAPTNVTYKLVIGDMDCWYCDIGKTSESTYHTGEEQLGKKFQAGNVIGRATSDTYIKIIPVKNDSAIGTATLKEFYSGTYTPY